MTPISVEIQDTGKGKKAVADAVFLTLAMMSLIAFSALSRVS
jgi:hypothetical protein